MFIKNWLNRYRSVFKYKEYISILGVAFASLAGDLIATVAIIWILTTETQSPAIFVTVAVVGTQASFAIASPYMGHLVDKYGPLNSLIGATLARTVVMGLLLLSVLYMNNGVSPWLLVGLLIVDHAITPITRSSEFVLTQIIIAEEDLNTANALQGIQFDLAFMIGPILGGIFTGTLGVAVGLGVNLVSFLLYGIVIYYLKSKDTISMDYLEQSSTLEEEKGSFWTSFKQGLQHIMKNFPLPWLIAMGFFWNLFILGPIDVVLPILTEEGLEVGPSVYGFLMAANSVGFTLGLIIMGGVTWRWPMALSSVIAVGILGGLYIAIGISSSVIVIFALLALGGLITAPTDIFSKRVRQKLVPVNKQGRVTSVSSLFGFMGSPLGAILVGGALHVSGNQMSGVILSACGLFLFVVSLIMATRPSLKSI